MRDDFGTSRVSVSDVQPIAPIELTPLEQRLVAVENEILRLVRTVATLSELITTERIDRKKADLNRDVFSIGDEPFPGHKG